MEPEQATVYARNELVIPAAPDRIWRWLCRAERWPEWYSNCAWIRMRDDDGPDLAPGTQFVWKTFGVRVRSQVLIYDRFAELGWAATAFGLRAYHGWLFEVVDAGRTRVITEETQVGSLTRVGRWYLRRSLLKEHQNWLEGLSRMAQTGDP
ncbi:MAG: SRPBCC domain-containing protein [Candidatus Binataceae bacterium]|jgi:hypothetical protein